MNIKSNNIPYAKKNNKFMTFYDWMQSLYLYLSMYIVQSGPD